MTAKFLAYAECLLSFWRPKLRSLLGRGCLCHQLPIQTLDNKLSDPGGQLFTARHHSVLKELSTPWVMLQKSSSVLSSRLHPMNFCLSVIELCDVLP